jgi:GlpG protein
MRLLATFKSEDEARAVSYVITKEGIQNQVDGKVDTDWGSDDYGTPEYSVWVIDEDQAEKAYAVFQEYQADPHHPRFQTAPPSPPLSMPQEVKKSSKPSIKTPITLYLIAICSLLLAWETMTSYSPTYMSRVKQDLLYDFPDAYQILDKLVSQYGVGALKNPQELPPKGALLIQQLKQHPYWEGIYDEALSYLTHGTFLPQSPWFEKISQGEVWRIFTPIFLHADIFHLLFNMIWLYVLGKQLEVHLKPLRYLLFIATAAAFTNTVQYLMGGPNFLGFSGVLVAMLTFIWKRQIDAPWEGYQLQRSTFLFMMIFIFGMLGLQMLSFTLEVATGSTLSTSIANAAHISGALFGVILAFIPYFTRENKI